VRIALYGKPITEHQLPHGITQCCLPPNAGERVPP